MSDINRDGADDGPVARTIAVLARAFDADRDDITDGPIARTLVVLAAPLLVQNLVQIVQQLVDTLWLGRHSFDAVAAVGLTFPIVGLLSAVGLGVGVGTQVLVSQRVGAENVEGGLRAAVNGTILGVLVGAVVGFSVAYVAADVVGLFDASATVTEYAAAYLAVYALAFPVLVGSDTVEYGFVGWGDSRAALYINVLAVAINVVLDPFLIFGWWVAPELGVAGAALATGVGYGAGFLLALGMAVTGRDGFVFTREVAVLDLDDWREIVEIGSPMTGQYAASQGARVAMIAVVAAVGGDVGLGAYTIGARVSTVAFVPASGLQQAAQSMVGQNLGANHPERARRTTWTGVAIAASALTVVGVVQWAIPGALSALFVPDATPGEIGLAAEYLRILTYGYWAIGATYLLQGGFNGARRTQTSMVASLLQYWIVRLPVALALAFAVTTVPLAQVAIPTIPAIEMGVQGAFWAVTISNVVAAIGLAAYYRYETNAGMNARAASAVTAD